jgi:uncharacterized phage protein gp47/JayE
MPFVRPTLNEIIARMEADASSRLLNNAPVLRRSFLGVLIRVFAGASHMIYGFLQWIANQVTPITADSEYLELHADTWGITRLAGSYAVGTVTFTGTDGSIIPKSTVIQRSDGVQYTTDAMAIILSGTISVDITAVEFGSNGNADNLTSVSLVNPIAGVNQACTTSSISGGSDRETIERLRARLLQRIQTPPQGGAVADFIKWALEVPVVYKPFVFSLYDYLNNLSEQPGHVGITFITSSGDRIPSSDDVAAVQNHIDIVKPATAIVKVYAPTKSLISFNIQLSPNTAAVQDAVKAELVVLFDREAAPNSTIPLSHINEAISIAVGEKDHLLVTPYSDIVSDYTHYPVPDIDNIVFEAL